MFPTLFFIPLLHTFVMRSISSDTRAHIVSLLAEGQSTRAIAQQTGVSAMTVSRIRRASMSETLTHRGGRPWILSDRDRAWMVRQVTSGTVDTATQLRREMTDMARMNVSDSTVRRALRDSGLKAIVKKKRPRLLVRHIKDRYEFAKRHKDWTVEDWKRVVWSDETKINRLGSDGRNYVWKRAGNRCTDQHVKPTVKFGGGSIMIWGCMTSQGVGYACRIEGTMDAELYRSILRDELTNTMEYYGLDRERMIFQQDRDSKHTSCLATQWFEDHGIRVLEWPAQSPDLNPIEHLWSHLKRRLGTYETEPSGILELWERVEREWNEIPVHVCVDLIESMPRRITALIKARGGHTKY